MGEHVVRWVVVTSYRMSPLWLCAAACALGISAAAHAASAQLRHRLGEIVITLHPEPHRVLVRGVNGAAPALPAWAQDDPSAPGLPPGWAAWIVPQADWANATRALLPRTDLAFISPLLRCDAGAWRIPTQDLLVGLISPTSVGKDGTDEESLVTTLLADFGLDPAIVVGRNEWGIPRLVRLRPALRDGAEVVRLADAMSDHPLVRFAEPDFLGEAHPIGAALGVNDLLFPTQWSLDNTGQSSPCSPNGSAIVDIDVNAPEAWALAQGNDSVIVLVIDNGIQFDHPDLLGDPALGFDATPDDGGGWPMHPCDNHGTAMAGPIAAVTNNTLGLASLSHGVRFASARISIPSESCSPWTVQSSWVAAALAWGEEIGASISNTSWTFLPSSIIEAAYAERAANGMLHVGGSANGGAPSVSFPARLPTVIAVGAITRSGNLAAFSNWGEEQELVAPGQNVRTVDRTGSAGYSGGSFACINGTSISATFVTATAALMRSANPALTAPQIREILHASTTDLGAPGWDEFFGHGLIRADLAVAAALALLPNTADLDGNGIVDGADLGILLNAWGPVAAATGTSADLNGDGVVDGADLGLLLNGWGP